MNLSNARAAFACLVLISLKTHAADFQSFSLSLSVNTTVAVNLIDTDGVAAADTPDPLAEARLPRAGRRTDIQIGFPRIAARLASTGDVRITTIFVDFSDVPAPTPPSAARTTKSVFDVISPAAENFWEDVSYGKLKVTLDPHLRRWLRMSKPSTAYDWQNLTFAKHKAYIQEAVNLAVKDHVDFSKSDAIAVIAHPDAPGITNGPAITANSGAGVTANGKIFDNVVTSGRDLSTWGFKWLNHEGGHLMGLVDLYSFTNPPPPPAPDLTHQFVGEFSLMGLISGRAPEYLGWERWLLAWLDDDEVFCAKSGSKTMVDLTPIETDAGKSKGKNKNTNRAGTKLVVIPTGGTTAVVVENRQKILYDLGLVRFGPLVYLVDTSIDSGAGPIRVLPTNLNDTQKLNAVMTVGQTITIKNSQNKDVSVKFVSANGDTVKVEVTRP